MITKQKIRINSIEEISIKTHAKKIIDDQTSEKLSEHFGQLTGHDHKKTN